MDIQKFTQKSLEAIQSAQNLAIENQNAQVEEEHLTLALLEQEDSLIKELLRKINANEKVEEELKGKLGKMPKITGGARPKDRNICITRSGLKLSKCRKHCKENER